MGAPRMVKSDCIFRLCLPEPGNPNYPVIKESALNNIFGSLYQKNHVFLDEGVLDSLEGMGRQGDGDA